MSLMHWRVAEVAQVIPKADWLTGSEAQKLYLRVGRLLSRQHYGFDPHLVRELERVPAQDAVPWLLKQIPLGDEPLLLIFASDHVCRVSASAFHEHWQDLFCPSRDDVVIVGETGNWVLYYTHEDEFEYGIIQGQH